MPPPCHVYDHKLGVNYDIAGSGWIVGAAVVGTSERKLFTVGVCPKAAARRAQSCDWQNLFDGDSEQGATSR